MNFVEEKGEVKMREYAIVYKTLEYPGVQDSRIATPMHTFLATDDEDAKQHAKEEWQDLQSRGAIEFVSLRVLPATLEWTPRGA